MVYSRPPHYYERIKMDIAKMPPPNPADAIPVEEWTFEMHLIHILHQNKK